MMIGSPRNPRRRGLVCACVLISWLTGVPTAALEIGAPGRFTFDSIEVYATTNEAGTVPPRDAPFSRVDATHANFGLSRQTIGYG